MFSKGALNELIYLHNFYKYNAKNIGEPLLLIPKLFQTCISVSVERLQELKSLGTFASANQSVLVTKV